MISTNSDLIITFVILVPVLMMCITAYCIGTIKPFIETKAYVKTELQRTQGEPEYKYWRREMSKLYVELIPLLGKFIARKMM
ncbi:MAG: hypothetical protein SPL89_00915 [Clostridia bacterium]|nr:hypothetical protein [Clostridia bacterium]